MNKKNLLIISTYYPNEINKASGVFVKCQVDELKNFFNNIYVLSLIPFIPSFLSNFSFVPKRASYNNLINNYKYDNVEVYYIRSLRFPFYFFGQYGKRQAKKVINFIKKNNIDFDIVHAHFTWPSGYVASEIKKKLFKPYVLTVHEDREWFLREINFPKKPFLKAWKNSDKIIRVNQRDLKEFKKININKNKLISIPNGFLEKYFKPMDKEIARDHLKLPKNKKILLNIANLEVYKGQKYLIKAMREVVKIQKNIILYILGRGSQKEKLKNMINQYNLENHVVLAGGNKPFEELAVWYNACDVFVLPSLSEGNPTVMFEALGCGKPFVGTNVGGIPEIINNKNFGFLVNPENIEQLTDKIIKALNSDWDSEIILNYSKQFSWNRITKKFMKIYNNLIIT